MLKRWCMWRCSRLSALRGSLLRRRAEQDDAHGGLPTPAPPPPVPRQQVATATAVGAIATQLGTVASCALSPASYACSVCSVDRCSCRSASWTTCGTLWQKAGWPFYFPTALLSLLDPEGTRAPLSFLLLCECPLGPLIKKRAFCYCTSESVR